MSLLDLPVEVLELVVDEFRLPDWYSQQERHDHLRAGLGLALACRKTHRLGLDLLYRKVRVSDYALATYLDAVLIKQIAPYDLIRDLDARLGPGCDKQPTPMQVASIFPLLSDLRSLSVRGDSVAVEQTLRSLYRGTCMVRLQRIYIGGFGGAHHDLPATVLRVLPHFPELQEVSLQFSITPHKLALPTGTISLPSCFWIRCHPDFDVAAFYRRLDASQVNTLTIGHGICDFAEHAAFLAAVPRLEELTVWGHGDSAVDFFTAALPHVKHMSSLRKIQYTCAEGRPPLLSDDGPLLSLLFDSLPPSLEDVELDLGCDAFPESALLHDFFARQDKSAQPLRRWQWYEVVEEEQPHSAQDALRQVVYRREVLGCRLDKSTAPAGDFSSARPFSNPLVGLSLLDEFPYNGSAYEQLDFIERAMQQASLVPVDRSAYVPLRESHLNPSGRAVRDAMNGS
ncbi:uncharacterized protein JCM10292_002111 [Rhodotorula paludigena]|uniref:uncharacterized protein n=1 Tax=Rhodotorula paludigena TaxID=86838 RepID=UPI00316C5241